MEKRLNILMIVVFLLLVLAVSQVSALTGNIGNSRMIFWAETGDTIENSVLVRNVNDVSVDITLEAVGDLAEDIEIEDTEFTLTPGEEKDVNFSIYITEPGTTESKINVRFEPSDGEGNGVGLSSTIIVIAEGEAIDPEPDWEIEILEVEDGETHLSDNVPFFIATDKEVSCSYNYERCAWDGDSVIIETCMHGGTEFEDPIENDGEYYYLDNTRGISDSYNEYQFQVGYECVDEFENTKHAYSRFYVDLSDIKEILIPEDIGEYNYLYSQIYPHVGDPDEVERYYDSKYEKQGSDIEFKTVILDVEAPLIPLTYIEENFIFDEGDAKLEFNGNLLIYNEEEKHSLWYSGDYVIYVLVLSDPDKGFIFPEEIVEAYLEKYPNEFTEQEINDLLGIEDEEPKDPEPPVPEPEDNESYFCKAGPVDGDLKIKDIKIDNNNGRDDKWKVTSEIEIEIEIKNTGDEDIDDVIVEIGLLDEESDNVILDMDFENSDEEEIKIGDIDEDEEETAVFKFKVPADFEDGNYKLIAKTYSDDLGEENLCVEDAADFNKDNYEKIKIEREDDEGKFIYFEIEDNEEFLSGCGESAILDFKVINIGDEDQDEVKVNIINAELGIDESLIIKNLDEGDREKVSFEFLLPKTIEEGVYDIILNADYDEKDGDYRESSEEDTIISLDVACPSSSSEDKDDDYQTQIIIGNSDKSDSNKKQSQNWVESFIDWFFGLFK